MEQKCVICPCNIIRQTVKDPVLIIIISQLTV